MSSLSDFLGEIGRHQLLTPEKELTMGRKVQEMVVLINRSQTAVGKGPACDYSEIERKIVSLRFGLDGSNEWRTLAEVARHMSCSREYCRQVVQRALRKLRKAGIQNGLVDSIS